MQLVFTRRKNFD